MRPVRGTVRRMQGERPVRGGLTRRDVLIGGGTLGVAAVLGVAATGSPFRGGRETVTFWHLFGGGDGERLTQILANIDAEHGDSDVRELILPWGNPYYTKLALAAVGGSPPDVAVVHATRLPSFAPAGLLEELTPEMLARHGLEGDRFLEQPWKSGQSGGRQYAIPLDTHPFVLYYNTDLVKEAGLLDGEGKLKPLDGEGALLDACEAVKDRTGKTGLVFETRGVTPWRVFLTLYSQLGGPPIIEEGGAPDRDGRRHGDPRARVDGEAGRARRRRAGRRLPGLGRVLQQPVGGVRAQRRVGGHHLRGDGAAVRHAHRADGVRPAGDPGRLAHLRHPA